MTNWDYNLDPPDLYADDERPEREPYDEPLVRDDESEDPEVIVPWREPVRREEAA